MADLEDYIPERMRQEPLDFFRRMEQEEPAVLSFDQTLNQDVYAALRKAACELADRYQLIQIPEDVYQIASVPFRLLPGDAVVAVTGADLPPKVENVLWSEFGPEQAELYKSLLATGRDR